MPPKRKKQKEESSEDEFVMEEAAEDGSDDEVLVVEEDDNSDAEPAKKKQKTSKETSKKTTTKKATTKKASSKKEEKETKSKASASSTTKKSSAKGGSKVEPIKSESEAKKAVYEFMKAQNRPYSVQGVVDNMGGRVKKAMATKALDALVESSKVTQREVGKNKYIFMINQDDMDVLGENELQKVDEEIKELMKSKTSLIDEVKRLQQEKDKAAKSLSNEELDEAIERDEKMIVQLQEDYERLSSSSAEPAKPEEKKAAMANLSKYVKLWKERKKLAMGVIDRMCEMRDAKKAELIDEFGVDTDESVGVDINEMGKMTYGK